MTAPSGLMKCSGYLTLLFSTPLGKKRSSLFPMSKSLYGLALKTFKTMDHQGGLQGSLGLPRPYFENHCCVCRQQDFCMMSRERCEKEVCTTSNMNVIFQNCAVQRVGESGGLWWWGDWGTGCWKAAIPTGAKLKLWSVVSGMGVALVVRCISLCGGLKTYVMLRCLKFLFLCLCNFVFGMLHIESL